MLKSLTLVLLGTLVTSIALAQTHPAPNNGGGQGGNPTINVTPTPPFTAPAHQWPVSLSPSGWGFSQPSYNDIAPGQINDPVTLTVGTGSWNAAWAAAYLASTVSGSITATNSVLLPSGPTIPINYLSCTDTLSASGGSQANPRISDCEEIYTYGVGTGTGNRTGLNVDMAITGTTTQTEGDAYYNGISDTIMANSNLGGVAGAEIGDVYGYSSQIQLQSGATHYASVHSVGEFDLAVEAGASVVNKIGEEIALTANDGAQGANIDAGLLFTDRGATNWNYGIEFGLPSGQGGSFPVSGTLLGSYVGGNAAYGINLSNISFSQYAIATKGFGVQGTTGHIDTTNSLGGPTLSACGTSPSMASGSSDTVGLVYVGSGTVTSCSLTFHSSFSNAPGGRSSVHSTAYHQCNPMAILCYRHSNYH